MSESTESKIEWAAEAADRELDALYRRTYFAKEEELPEIENQIEEIEALLNGASKTPEDLLKWAGFGCGVDEELLEIMHSNL